MKIFAKVALVVLLFTGVGLAVASTANAASCCSDTNQCCKGPCCQANATDCLAYACPV
jgi:hypothetical protein